MSGRQLWLDEGLRRAVREVLKSHTIGLIERDGQHATYAVHRGRRCYRVVISRDWLHPPRCDCPELREVAVNQEPDAHELAPRYCKHTIAVLLDQPDHRHQLIELLL